MYKRQLPLKTHLEVWRSAFITYGQSFEESFAWSRKRKEKASKKKVEENMLALRDIVRDVQEATPKTPEVERRVATPWNSQHWRVFHFAVVVDTAAFSVKRCSIKLYFCKEWKAGRGVLIILHDIVI